MLKFKGNPLFSCIILKKSIAPPPLYLDYSCRCLGSGLSAEKGTKELCPIPTAKNVFHCIDVLPYLSFFGIMRKDPFHGAVGHFLRVFAVPSVLLQRPAQRKRKTHSARRYDVAAFLHASILFFFEETCRGNLSILYARKKEWMPVTLGLGLGWFTKKWRRERGEQKK